MLGVRHAATYPLDKEFYDIAQLRGSLKVNIFVYLVENGENLMKRISGSGALSGKMLLVGIVENTIDA